MGLVIGFYGPAKSGKDTSGDYLIYRHGFHEKLSFARNLKEMVKKVFSLKEDDVNTQEGKERLFPVRKILTKENISNIFTWMFKTHSGVEVFEDDVREVLSKVGTKFENPRQILQFVGTDICRKVVPTYHVDVVKEKVLANPNKNYVITDVRFPNEGDLILDDLKGYVVRLYGRPSKKIQESNHLSETAMSEWGRASINIDNGKDGFHNLYGKLDGFLRGENII